MPEIGDVWTTRVFRDTDLRLRVFKLVSFGNLSIGVVDQEDYFNQGKQAGQEKVIWFSKGDLQFFDLLQAGKKPDEKATSQGQSDQPQGDRRANSAAGGSGPSSNDARVRQERNR